MAQIAPGLSQFTLLLCYKMLTKKITQPIPVAERLKKREEYYTVDEAIPLMIKSGDIEGLKWLFQKGWPMSYKGNSIIKLIAVPYRSVLCLQK